MKVLVLVVLLCLAGVAQARDNRGKNLIKTACMEEHGFNATHVETLKTRKQLSEYLPLDKWICVFACMLERNLEGGETSYNIIYDSIERDIPVTVNKWNPKEMKDMLNKCKAKYGENGCDFFKCLKVDEEPFDSYLRIPSYYL